MGGNLNVVYFVFAVVGLVVVSAEVLVEAGLERYNVILNIMTNKRTMVIRFAMANILE